MANSGTTAYPATLDGFLGLGTARTEDEAGYTHVALHNQDQAAIMALEQVVGTTAGTGVLTNFSAGDLVAKTVGDTFGTPTIQNPTIGTPSLSNGTVDPDLFMVNTSGTITAIKDENDMASNSDNALATQQSIKAYVDNSAVTGWITSGDTWVYASASTFTIAGVDRTSVYTKGTRLKFTQTSTKYAVVLSSTFSTNTTVTIMVNTDYTIANAAITTPTYSYHNQPDYPHWFNVAAPVFTVGELDNGAGGQPTTSETRLCIDNHTCYMHWRGNGTKAGSANYFSFNLVIPIANSTSRSVIGSSYVYTSDNYPGIVMNSNTLTCYFVFSDTIADNITLDHIAFSLAYEI